MCVNVRARGSSCCALAAVQESGGQLLPPQRGPLAAAFQRLLARSVDLLCVADAGFDQSL